ncbi:MAG: Sulfur oxidation protein SoxY [uncultured Sulfurovum sp.]|uniref:Sulfur oxidation protein SoxY n=1 Tax=uncultured Sulfurovum sp. TaxID=269237 RepID=A0A6S6SDK0_9BACT|nr:MAG: Sulfur oxidation protein SoxY [uncultured Sulfurovum sp.]
MERRKFLGLGLVAAALVPASLNAVDFRATKPAAWSASSVADAIKALYGDIKPVEGEIKLTVPKKAANPGAVPVKVKSKIAMKSLTVLQDANSAAAVATYTMDKDTIVDISIKIKMGKPGTITIIGEGQDGKFYSASKKVDLGEAC